jgi:xylono-1,5-lactonase
MQKPWAKMRDDLWKPGMRSADNNVQCIWPLDARLGEGPCWSAADNALWFVDIFSNMIHRFELGRGSTQSWPAPDKVSFILPDENGTFVVGLPGAVARFRPGAGEFDILARVEQQYPENRLNDAAIDRTGRLWFGTMDQDARSKCAALYRWGHEGAPVQMDSGYCISNGPAFSPDNHWFYFTDTLDRVIYRFEVEDSGRLRGKTRFLTFQEADGYPDGTTIDAEGCLWVAFYGGWAVRRFSPEGKLMREVKLPCANVTKLAFGGDDLETALVTTARDGVSAEALGDQPLAGGLFAFEAGVRGLAQTAWTAKLLYSA